MAKTSTSRVFVISLRWTGRDQLLAPPLTGPFFIGKRTKESEDKEKVAGERAFIAIRVDRTKTGNENKREYGD